MKTTDLQNPLKKLQQRKELLVILLFLFVIIIFWIGLSIFSSQQTTGITPEQQKLAKPLTPVLDAAVIEKLEQKKMYDPSELAEFPIVIPESTTQVQTTGGQSSAGTTQVVLPQALEGQLETLEESF